MVAAEKSDSVTRYSFATINAGDLQNKLEYDFASIAKDKAFRRKLDDLIKDGKKQVKNEEERTAFSWCKMATATTVCLAGAGSGIAIGLATGNIALLFPLTTAPFGFLAGWMVDKGDTKALQAMKGKLALLQSISTRLKERKQANKLEQERQAAQCSSNDWEQDAKHEQGRQFKELAKLNQEKQDREYEKRMQEEQPKQVTFAPAAIAASSIPKRGCTCSTHMNELKALHEKVVASQKTPQQSATTSSAEYYAHSTATSRTYLPYEKRFKYNDKEYFVRISQCRDGVEVHEYVYDYCYHAWKCHARAFLSYEEAFKRYGQEEQ